MMQAMSEYTKDTFKKLEALAKDELPSAEAIKNRLNDEAVMADHIVSAALNPEFSSLNLAQAVLMMAWEWRMAALEQQNAPETDDWPELATIEERDFFFRRFETMLDEKGFFATQEMAPIVKRNLRSFFTRATPTKQEMRTWQGILTKLNQE